MVYKPVNDEDIVIDTSTNKNEHCTTKPVATHSFDSIEVAMKSSP